MRHFSLFDQILVRVASCVHPSLNLMRVNHSGEVAAQALYKGQAFGSNNPDLTKKLQEAAKEEEQHLAWCRQRIQELNGKPSILNPIWAAGSFALGTLAGLLGDKISLGFLAETEYQVVAHLDKHLELLPENDHKSREILLKMREDELKHATHAVNEGAIKFPGFIRKLMNSISKVMTRSSYYI